MAAPLSVLSSLERLVLEFQSPQSRPDRESRSLPPPKRSILPALDYFRFVGVIEYLEDFVTFIDATQLKRYYLGFSEQIEFDTPQLAQFVNRTAKPTDCDAHVEFNEGFACVGIPSGSDIVILPRGLDRQLSSIVRVCNSSFHPLSIVEDLYIEDRYWPPVWKNDAIENTLWLQLLVPYTAVKTLYLSEEFAPGIAAALQELVGDRIIEVLPSLQNIFVKRVKPSEPFHCFQKNIGPFVAA